MTKLTPQQLANQRQNKKRQSLSKYLLIMSDDDAIMLKKLAEIHGSKKAAIFEGLRLLSQQTPNPH